jgi:hypothetical protein
MKPEDAPCTTKVLQDIENGGVVDTGDGARYWLMNLVAALKTDGVCSEETCDAIIEKAYPVRDKAELLGVGDEPDV